MSVHTSSQGNDCYRKYEILLVNYYPVLLQKEFYQFMHKSHAIFEAMVSEKFERDRWYTKLYCSLNGTIRRQNSNYLKGKIYFHVSLSVLYNFRETFMKVEHDFETKICFGYVFHRL